MYDAKHPPKSKKVINFLIPLIDQFHNKKKKSISV